MATIYGLPEILDPLEMQEQQIIVELVTVAEHTVSQKPVEKTEKTTPPPAPELKQTVESEIEPNPDKTPLPPPEPARLTPPPPPKMIRVATLKLTEPPKAEPLPDKTPKPKPVEVAMPKPKAPIKPKRKPKPSKTDLINNRVNSSANWRLDFLSSKSFSLINAENIFYKSVYC